LFSDSLKEQLFMYETATPKKTFKPFPSNKLLKRSHSEMGSAFARQVLLGREMTEMATVH